VINVQQPFPEKDFEYFLFRFRSNIPTTYVRFSDGEIEILRNHPLSITNGVVDWRLGRLDAKYPEHDNKSFIPERDRLLRIDLLESALYRANGYFKGVPTSSNNAKKDRDYMIHLNGGITKRLTFADLFINENYKRFLHEILPYFVKKNNVTFLGNYRANVSAVSKKWSHIPIEDNLFPKYEEVAPQILGTLRELTSESIVLSSASSLSNILGSKLHKARPDITFVDVGTSLSPFMDLGKATRAYHSQLLPWSPKNTTMKLNYLIFGNHKMKW
jgi:hypothetical protein